MMTIIAYFYISIVIIILLGLILFFIKNIKTSEFRIYILNMSYNHLDDYYNNIDWDSIDWRDRCKLYEKASSLYKQINDKYKYEEMLFSIKPLKLDKWFTEEEVNFIKFGTLK